MPRKRQDSYDASYLLNFRSGIPSDLPSTSFTPDFSRKNKKALKKLEAERQETRAREKMRSSFFLYASSAHAFVISRTKGKRESRLKNDGNEADKVVAWESVRIVKVLCAVGSASDEESSSTTCAICLGDYIAPRITKCGHLFCYPCILRHFQSSSEKESADSMAKCPCCFHWVEPSELRPVQFVTVQTPEVSTVMEFRKLYRYRGCPAPFLPCKSSQEVEDSKNTVTIGRRVGSGDLPTATDQDACFSRTTYVDTSLYQQHLLNDIASLEDELENITIMYQSVRGNASSDKDKFFVSIAMQAVKKELGLAISSADEENQLRSELDDIHNEHCLDVLPYYPTEKKTWNDRKEEGHLLNAKTEEKNKSSDAGSNMSKRIEPGMMYMGENCVQFYQANDGQLCFLSGFNLNCLSHEFSANDPGSGGSTGQNDCEISVKPPFPDLIKGRVVEVERKHLTPDIRKRMGCFSHLPLYTDIMLAELDVFNLSRETRNFFKKDIERRKNKRRAKRDMEKKAERDARIKEEQRIEELKRGIQRIDPNDTFFHSVPTTETNVFNREDFAHSLPRGDNDLSTDRLPASNAKVMTKMTFSSVCVSESAFPALDTTNDTAFPSLSSASSSYPPLSSKNAVPWNSPSSSRSDAASSSTLPTMSRTSSSKKKGKGKKTVLFSTGGRRSGY